MLTDSSKEHNQIIGQILRSRDARGEDGPGEVVKNRDNLHGFIITKPMFLDITQIDAPNVMTILCLVGMGSRLMWLFPGHFEAIQAAIES